MYKQMFSADMSLRRNGRSLLEMASRDVFIPTKRGMAFEMSMVYLHVIPHEKDDLKNWKARTDMLFLKKLELGEGSNRLTA